MSAVMRLRDRWYHSELLDQDTIIMELWPPDHSVQYATTTQYREALADMPNVTVSAQGPPGDITWHEIESSNATDFNRNIQTVQMSAIRATWVQVSKGRRFRLFVENEC